MTEPAESHWMRTHNRLKALAADYDESWLEAAANTMLMAEGRIKELEAENIKLSNECTTWYKRWDRLHQIIADAPHAENCTAIVNYIIGGAMDHSTCDCWKSRLNDE